jgi:hypothetical protein
MKRHISLITLLVGAIVIPLASTVSAAEITRGAAGFGIGGAPDCEGSSDYEPIPLPFLTIGDSASAARKVALMILP